MKTTRWEMQHIGRVDMSSPDYIRLYQLIENTPKVDVREAADFAYNEETGEVLVRMPHVKLTSDLFTMLWEKWHGKPPGPVGGTPPPEDEMRPKLWLVPTGEWICVFCGPINKVLARIRAKRARENAKT